MTSVPKGLFRPTQHRPTLSGSTMSRSEIIEHGVQVYHTLDQ